MLKPGEIVDRYEVLARIGQGGMAEVYLVRHIKLKTTLALKVHLSTKTSVKVRFAKEGRMQASLRHPNVVFVSDVIDMGERAGLVMEYVEGPTLTGLLRRYRLPLHDAIAIFRGVALGIGAAHARGLVHRDLKPSNVLLTVSNGLVLPQVTDFGLAKDLMNCLADQTRPGVALGTPSYMPPEQIRDASKVDRRADIYGLGCLLYALCCGRPPHRGRDIVELLQRIEGREYLQPENLAPLMPAALADIIRAMLEPDKLRRLSDVPTLLRRLDSVTTKPVSDETIGLVRGLQDDVRRELAVQQAQPRLQPVSQPPRRPTRAHPSHEDVKTLVVADDARDQLCRALMRWSVNADGVAQSTRALSKLLSAARRGDPYKLVVVDQCKRGALLHDRIARDPRLCSCHVVTVRLDGSGDDAQNMYRSLLNALQLVSDSELAVTAPDVRTAGHVLLVEDNPVQRMVVSQTLKRLGYRVTTVSEVRTAQRVLRRRGTDVVLLDLHLPDAEGVSAIHAVQTGLGGPPVVVMSADDRAETRHEAEQLGIRNFLIKPVNPEVLARVIRAVLARSVEDSSVDGSVLDVSVLSRLSGLLESEGAVGAIVDLFVNDVETEQASWRRILARKDRRALPALARRLQPAAAHLGAVGLHAACERVLRLDAAAPWADVEQAVTELLLALQLASGALQYYRRESPRRAG